MASARVMWKGFCVMLAACLAGVIMAFGFGLLTDTTISEFDSAGIFDIDPDSGWSGFYESTTAQGINLLYFVCYLPPILGIAYFILCVFRSYWRQDSEEYY